MKTMLLAIGNAGGNILESIRSKTKHAGMKQARYVFADCDANDLIKHNSDDCGTILLDYESGLFPAEIFAGLKKLAIVSGLGGKTATKFTELATMAAKNAGVDSINVVATLPFQFEGEERIRYATLAAHRLSEVEGVKTIIFNNEGLRSRYAELSFLSAFETADKEIMEYMEKN